ncbi:Tannase [Dactylellina cionopaga]|nr:Tannase [Dactylellina cionopaga]
MKVSSICAVSAVIFGSGAAATQYSNFERQCSQLARTFRPDENTAVLLSEFVPKGANFTNPDNHPTCQKSTPYATVLADMCRLRLNLTTSTTSSVLVEAWLPVDWNEKGRRFLMTGNGGLGGCMPYSDMKVPVALGFATIGHNNGHTGDTGVPFFNRPEVITDYLYRALFVATKIGKKAVNQFYRRPITKSYYSGCSCGGRQGLKAAQEFPEEYDGIVAGAPANDQGNLLSAYGHYYKALGKPGDPTYVNQEQWLAVHKLVVSQCDGLDGVLDGVIEDPRACHPRPEAIICSAGQTWASHKCLTSAQVSAVRTLYEPFYGNKGKLIYPRMNPGGELLASRAIVASGKGPLYTEDWFRYVIFNNKSWSIDTDFTLDAIEYSNERYTEIKTWDDLTKMKAAGTKLLMYHGLQDGLISSENSYRYYEHVSRSMSLPSEQLDEFFRYFPIPGADHCRDGDGAWYLGGAAQFVIPGIQNVDIEGGVLMSMVKWVEDGIAPERIIARNIAQDGKEHGIKAHCKWPMKNVYVGGNPAAKESWGCQ